MQGKRERDWRSLRRRGVGEVSEGGVLAMTGFKQERRESNSGLSSDVLFGVS